ncbi:MAG TPA: hypothetical protein VKC61_02795 [Pyrinomonadaceae bacterium]|nr:hypothetical protein [Pyrinomonadaceae bacterium]
MATMTPITPAKELPTHVLTLKWMDYQAGGKDSSNVEIVKIIHRDEKGAIYLIRGDKGTEYGLKWHVEDNLGAHWNRATAVTRRLLAPVKRVLKDKEDRYTAILMLAAGLVMALEANPPDLEQDYLAEAASYIRDRQKENLQIVSFSASVVTLT